MGLPGAGKTTTATVLSQLTGAVRLSSDEVRTTMFPQATFSQAEHDQVYAELDRRTTQLLTEGHDVIYDANLNRRLHRDEKYAICRQAGAQARLLWIQTPRELAKQRARHESRTHLWPPSMTADQLFEHVASVIEPPGPDEPHTAIDGTKVTPEYVRTCLGL